MADDLRELSRRLASPVAIGVRELSFLWRSREPEGWSVRPELYELLGSRLLERGEPLLAYEPLQAGLEARPQAPALRRLMALALARSGALGPARELLERLRREGHRDEETLGILARTYKDASYFADRAPEISLWRRKAYRCYLEAFRRSGGHYSGINAAAMALLVGERDASRALARAARRSCLAGLVRAKGGGREAYWLEATLGEAALILREWDEARRRYGRAATLFDGNYGNLASTRRQARRLLSAQGAEPDRMDSCFRVPRVVAFSGHRIDTPGRPEPRFPPRLERQVRAELSRRLQRLDAGFGFSSAACGSDLLFIEEMLERGGAVHIVLPCPPEEFRKASVALRPRSDWGRRFDEALRRAVRVQVASERGLSGPVAHEYADRIAYGMAVLKARSLDAEASCLAVWDGKGGDGPGETASAVSLWRARSAAVEIIPLAAGGPDGRRRPPAAARAPKAAASDQRICALLFADTAGYTRLTEDQIPLFAKSFLDVPGRLAREWARPPVIKESWGDSIYLVFEGVEDAGQFALELNERINRRDWRKDGLPQDLRLRIALHAGPVFRIIDPVTGQLNFLGCHVNFTARMEPITPPGQVYASEAFAALAAAHGIEGVSCGYVGQTILPKRFGVFPLYHLRRPGAA